MRSQPFLARGSSSTASAPDLLLSANSLWNITNFRARLIRSLAAEGYRLTVAAPFLAEEAGAFVLPANTQEIVIDRSGMNPLHDGQLLLAYARIMRRLRPAAYLGWTIKPNIYGALAARLCGVPSVLNVSGLGTAFLSGSLMSRAISMLYTIAFRGARIVFFQNKDDRTLFVRRGIVSERQARLLPGSGIDLDRFRATPVPVGTGCPIFLLIARLLGDKGIREFVEAARVVRAEIANARCQLLGSLDPDNRSAIGSDELAQWIDEGSIEYLGSTDDVRPFVEKATAVILPSYREGLPRTLLEGGAMGRPLIATDVPGCRDVVIDGVNGFLCQPADSGSLAYAMLRLGALSPGELASMGRAARDHVQERFDEELVVDAYVDVLRDVIGLG
jgi:glycosyltransferase involved in cell wall biosynthesis